MKEGTPNLDASHWFHVDLGDLLWNGSFLPDANISSHRFTQSHQVLLFTVRETRFSLTFSFAIFVYCSQVLSLESFRTFVKFSQISWSSYFFFTFLYFSLLRIGSLSELRKASGSPPAPAPDIRRGGNRTPVRAPSNGSWKLGQHLDLLMIHSCCLLLLIVSYRCFRFGLDNMNDVWFGWNVTRQWS